MMVRVSQSATGQYVVSHDPSDTVMVGDDLVELYERMKAHLEASPGGLEHSPAPGPNAARGSGWARWALVLVACVLPFVWLGVLHLSLGQLVSELTMVTPDHDSPDDQDLRARVERLERGRLQDSHGQRFASGSA